MVYRDPTRHKVMAANGLKVSESVTLVASAT
jgi:hypothetical protein